MKRRHPKTIRMWVSIGNDGVSVEVPAESCLDQAERFYFLRACNYISLSEEGPWSTWSYHRALDDSERTAVCGLR